MGFTLTFSVDTAPGCDRKKINRLSASTQIPLKFNFVASENP